MTWFILEAVRLRCLCTLLVYMHVLWNCFAFSPSPTSLSCSPAGGRIEGKEREKSPGCFVLRNIFCYVGKLSNRVKLAGGGRGLPFGHNESAVPVCFSHSSSSRQTSFYLRASLMCRYCNGFLPFSPGTNTLPLATAEEKRKREVHS